MTFEKAKVHETITPGEALKMIRELQGLSQNDLAELTNTNQSNIWVKLQKRGKYELEANPPLN